MKIFKFFVQVVWKVEYYLIGTGAVNSMAFKKLQSRASFLLLPF
jgi:hypothetical protein